MIKKVLLCATLLFACMQFNSCGKETDGIPPAIQRLMADENGSSILYQVDEYYYNGEKVYKCESYSIGGIIYIEFVTIRTYEGFAIAGWDNIDNPQNTWGCAEHFLQNSQYIRNLWFKWQ